VAELHPDAWPVIAMGHLYVAGAKVLADDESENIFIGNLQGVESGIFDGFTYTALGHLHRRQLVDDKSVVRYAGAPLPMSFTERHYDQGVELIETDSGAHTVSVTSLHFDAPVKLHSIEGNNLDEVIQKIDELPAKDGSEDESLLPVYDVTVKVDAYSSSVKDSVIEALAPKAVRLAKISLQLNSEVQSSSDISIKEAETMKPIDMAKMCYKDQLGTDMPLNLCSLMEKVIDEVVEQ
jgi:exonuclease SbcD